jgi:hypothetical protein
MLLGPYLLISLSFISVYFDIDLIIDAFLNLFKVFSAFGLFDITDRGDSMCTDAASSTYKSRLVSMFDYEYVNSKSLDTTPSWSLWDYRQLELVLLGFSEP